MLRKTDTRYTSDVDLLAFLVGNRRTASALLQEAKGSLFTLLCGPAAEAQDLFCSEGTSIYRGAPHAKLQAAREIAARAIAEQLTQGDTMSSPLAVKQFLILRLAGIAHEVFAMLLLDAQNRVIAFDEMFRGTLTQTSVYPREVVKRALRDNAAAVIFAHNHPSGVPEPSHADQVLTQSLKQSLALVDVRVLDHFIVAGNQTLSFAERGLL